ncbi:MAG: PepSY domain-containing protein [Zavarzinia sp.]|nr:PepSY domain-containing protein [Zavarzinia sp.]
MALLLAFCLSPGAALAGDDHERALEALREGRILPVEAILDAARKDFGGDVLDIELEDEDEGFIYEIKLIAADGRIMKLDYDAATGQLLRVRQRHGGNH